MPELATGTTNGVATTTSGATDVNTQATTSGADTGTAQPSQGTTSTSTSTTQQAQQGQAQADPKVTAALKTLEDAGLLGKDVLTRDQFNGHMGAARKQWEKDAKTQAEQAAAEAQAKALQEQGQFKPLYEQAQTELQGHKAQLTERDTLIASLSEIVNAQINDAIKTLPPVLKEFDPGPENVAARREWFAKIQKHPEALRPSTGNGGQPAYYGTGATPSPLREQGTNRTSEITPPASRHSF